MQEHKQIQLYVGLEEGGCVDVGAIKLDGFTLIATSELEALKTERIALQCDRAVLLTSLEELLEDNCPLTGNPSYKELVEHWEYEQAQGRGNADIYLQAIGAVLMAKAGAQ